MASIPYINQLVIMVILLTLAHIDHTSKIQERMGRESIVPANNVRYVSVNQLGKALQFMMEYRLIFMSLWPWAFL